MQHLTPKEADSFLHWAITPRGRARLPPIVARLWSANGHVRNAARRPRSWLGWLWNGGQAKPDGLIPQSSD